MTHLSPARLELWNLLTGLAEGTCSSATAAALLPQPRPENPGTDSDSHPDPVLAHVLAALTSALTPHPGASSSHTLLLSLLAELEA